MTLKILQFGASGQLGREMLARQDGGVEVRALSRAEADLTDTEAIARVIGEAKDIDLVFNAAAYTAVDRAESEPDLAYAINARAPEAMARACQARGVPLIHISTDMVFSGAKTGPYVETDHPAPLHVYGASKLAGETAVLNGCERAMVARVSWLFSALGRNFLQMMLGLAANQPTLQVADDQIARPTASGDVAAFLLSQAQRLARAPTGAAEWGLLHLANEGAASRLDMARALFDLAWSGRPPPIMEAVSSDYFKPPARRALNAELATDRLKAVFGLRLRPWREALEDVVAELPPALLGSEARA